MIFWDDDEGSELHKAVSDARAKLFMEYVAGTGSERTGALELASELMYQTWYCLLKIRDDDKILAFKDLMRLVTIVMDHGL